MLGFASFRRLAHLYVPLTLIAVEVFLLAVSASPALAVGETADGVWSQLVPDAVALPRIEAVSSVYDPARNRMLMFGGYDSSSLVARLFALDLSGDPRWSEPALVGPAPSARYGNSLVYDSARDRVILFGGNASGDQNQPLGDTWVLSPGAPMSFTQLVTSGVPPARYGHSAVYDPVRDRMLVLFGYDGSFRADVWQLTLSGTPTWSPLTTVGTSPSARDFTSAVYDPIGDRVVVVGGNALPGPVPRSDAWSLNLTGTPTWSPISPSGSPAAGRFSAASFYDPVRQRMVILGGTDGSAALSDVVTLSLSGAATWQVVSPGGRLPAGRWAAAAAYDTAHDRAVWTAGLATGSYFLNDTWLLALAGSPQWTEPPTANSPLPRSLAGAAYDSTRDELVVYGGLDHGFLLDDLWALPMAAGASWVSLDYDLAFRPSARAGATMVLDSRRDRLVLFGGSSSNDLWTFDLAARQWSPLSASGTPPAQRAAAGSFYDALRDRMIVFGGYDMAHNVGRNDTWELDFLPQPHWVQLAAAGPPPPRYGAAVVYDVAGDRMVVFGGELDEYSRYNDSWCLPLSGASVWTQLLPGGTIPPGIGGQAAIADPVRRRLVVYGGESYPFDSNRYYADAYTLSLSGDAPMWSKAPPLGLVPGFRVFPSAAYDSRRDRMVMHGGRSPIKPGSLDFDSDGTTWAYTWGDLPTPTLLSLVDFETGPGHVTLRWQAADAAHLQSTVERSADDITWMGLGTPRLEGTDLLVYDDVAMAPGRYFYRLDYSDGTLQRFSDPVVVEVPAAAQLSLGGFHPNPAMSSSAIVFSLPDAKRSLLEVVDVRGRIVLSREVGALGPGPHSLPLSEAGRLGAGVYWVRLVRPETTLTRKGVVAG